MKDFIEIVEEKNYNYLIITLMISKSKIAPTKTILVP